MSAQTWTQLSDFPSTERDDGVGVSVGTKAFFGTGNRTGLGISGDLYSLDLGSETWSTLATMPSGSERQYAVCFSNGTHLFVYGGFGNGSFIHNDMYSYNISANTWSLMGTRPSSVGVIGASSFTLGSKAYVFCGRWGTDAQVSSQVWEYDMSTNTWTQKNDFPGTATWRGCAAVLNGTAYVSLGRNASDGLQREMYRYDQSNDTWTKVGDFPNAKRYYVQMQAVNNKLVMVGGIDTLNIPFAETWFFDEVNGFVQESALPSSARKGGMSISYQNKFYYTCGWTSIGHTKQTWKLDLPVGLKENRIEEKDLHVGPNPFSDELIICSELKGLLYELYQTDGRILSSGILEERSTINTKGLSKGAYFLRIFSSEHSFTKKVIRN